MEMCGFASGLLLAPFLISDEAKAEPVSLRNMFPLPGTDVLPQVLGQPTVVLRAAGRAHGLTTGPQNSDIFHPPYYLTHYVY